MTASSDCKPSYIIPLLINGKETITSTTFDVTSPDSGEVLWHCSNASKDDALRAVESAQAAFPSWSRTVPSERRNILLRAADILERRGDEIVRYVMAETGSVASFAEANISSSADGLRDIAGRISSVHGEIPTIADPGSSALIIREPYGVIFSSAPW
jgi:acyl-CoA reductase-like NAD-dependent aldehyde dehydrogenase